jgi:hypothetical protein
MHVRAASRRVRAILGFRGQSFALQNKYLLEALGERARGGELAHSRADHDGMFIKADVIAVSQLAASSAAEVPRAVRREGS